MIFYTIQGPGYELEIHDDKMKLSKRTWLRQFSGRDAVKTWELKTLAGFEITPHFFWGKIEWKAEDGTQESFRFSTNPEMVKKIEKYMQKMILKNIHRKNQLAISA
ncbi:MAG: hypothetical protein ACJ76H_12705 [Bacteriovoracaceae bacterium]